MSADKQIEWKPTHRHVKSGRLERVIGEAKAQVSTGMLSMDIGPKYTRSRHYRPLHDGDRVVVYQGAKGELWVRFPDEFNDGRFEPLSEETKEIVALGGAADPSAHDAEISAVADAFRRGAETTKRAIVSVLYDTRKTIAIEFAKIIEDLAIPTDDDGADA